MYVKIYNYIYEQQFAFYKEIISNDYIWTWKHNFDKFFSVINSAGEYFLFTITQKNWILIYVQPYPWYS